MTTLNAMLHALFEPLQLIFMPAKRVYWGSLLFSLGLALFVLLRQRRGPLAEQLRQSFGWRIWAHPSARLDYMLIFTKAALRVVLIAPWAGGAWGLALLTVRGLQRSFGLMPPSQLSPWAITAIYTLSLFVLWDLSRYLLHRWLHRVPLLWEFHKLHHSAEVLTPFSLYRSHPVESALYALRGLLVTGVVTGLFFYLFGAKAVQYKLLGVNILGFVFNFAGGNLRHSAVWLRYPAWLERWLISPAQHQIHHSRSRSHFDKNFGTWLSVWDRLGGSLVLTRPRQRLRFGLTKAELNHDPHRLGSALVDPPLAAARTIGSWLSRRPRAELRDRSELLSGLLILSLLAPQLATAQETATATTTALDGAWQVEEISIVGARSARARVAGSAHKITEAELERAATNNVHELLKTVPGVYVRTEDGYGLRPNIGLRGANSDRSAKIVLMEDGVLLGPAPYSAPAAYFFPMTTRMVGIEVFKGPASIRSGPNTIGGAINLLSRPPPREATAYLDLSGGNHSTGKLHAYAGSGGERWGVLLEGVRLQTEGFKELPSGDSTGFEKNELVLNGRYNTNPAAEIYQQWDLRASYSSELSHETYLGLTRADFEDNPYQRYPASQLGRMKWHHTQLRADYLLEAEALRVRATLYRRDFDRTWRHLNSFASGDSFNNILNYPTGVRAILLGQLKGEEPITELNDLRMGTNHRIFISQGLQIAGEYSFETGPLKHELRFGARLHFDQIRRRHDDTGYLMSDGLMSVDPTSPERRATQNTASTWAIASYLQDEIELGPLLFSPGLRVEHIMREFEDELADTHADGEDTVFIPGLGVFYSLTPSLGLLAGVHKGFSPVSPGQSSSVKPESSINYEAGARLKAQGLRAELIGFFSDYSNLTGECTMSSGGCSSADLNDQFNGGSAWVYGLEADLKYQAKLYKQISWRAQLSYTLTHTEFKSSFSSSFSQWGEVEEGDAFPYVPVHAGHAALGVFGRRWAVDLGLTGATAMRDVASQGHIQEAERTGAFLILDLAAHYDLLDYLSVYGTLKNVLDTAYVASLRPYGARPGAPLQAMLGLRLKI